MSTNGFGGIFFGMVILSHSVHEILHIVIAFELWESCLAYTSIVIHSDNTAVVHVIYKTTLKDTKLTHLMRRLMNLSLSQNVHFRAEHIHSIANTAANLFFRLQVQEFMNRFPHMDIYIYIHTNIINAAFFRNI